VPANHLAEIPGLTLIRNVVRSSPDKASIVTSEDGQRPTYHFQKSSRINRTAIGTRDCGAQ
jgi:hypothetical protein